MGRRNDRCRQRPAADTECTPLPGGYIFKRGALQEQALTHRSRGTPHSERLEFLGDAVLGLLIADELYRRYPDVDEGALSPMRSSLVEGRTLTRLAQRLCVHEHLRVGAGVEQVSDAMLADAVEALIGALYLDAGMEECRAQVLDWYQEELQKLSPQYSGRNAKTLLQEHMQAQGALPPVYHTLGEHGRPHERWFTILCETVSGRATAHARSKGEAERLAAEALLQHIHNGAARSPQEELAECLLCLGRPAPAYYPQEWTAGAGAERAVVCELDGGEHSVQAHGTGTQAAVEAQAAELMLTWLCTRGAV